MATITIDPNSHLSPDVARDYEVVNWPYGYRAVFPAYSRILHNGTVNLQLITLNTAALLVKNGFPHLRKREAAPKKPTEPADKGK